MLLRRLAQVEEQLDHVKVLNTNTGQNAGGQARSRTGGRFQTDESSQEAPRIVESPVTSTGRHDQDPIWDERTAFAGETSARYNLDHMEDRLDRLGVDRPARAASPPTQVLTRPATPTLSKTEWKHHRDLRHLIRSHGIPFDLEKWESWLKSFFDEVHPLYPLLHPPSLWEQYNHMWTPSWDIQGGQNNQEYDADLKLAQLFLIMATGRCTTALRSKKEGRHSAGWSFYCVATDLIGDVLNLCGNRGSPLLQLQTLCLIVSGLCFHRHTVLISGGYLSLPSGRK